MYNILKVSQNHYIRGGSDRYFFTLSELLKKKGHQVIPFTAASSHDEPSEWNGYFPRGSNFEDPKIGDLLRFLYSPDAVKSIRRLQNDVKVDIAHFHIYYGKLTASILGELKKTGIPLIQTLHDFKLTCPVHSHISNGEICEDCEGKHFWRAIPKRCNRGSMTRTTLNVTESYISKMLGSVSKFDHFISVCHFNRKKMIQYGIPEDKISTIHNFVDVSDITPNYDVGEYLLYFGRLYRAKGIFSLIDAALPLTHVPLYIVGDGESFPEIQQILNSNGCDHIKLLGFKQGEELHELIKNSICSVLPSELYENCPMSILESFTYGKPAIGAEIGGIPEIIVDGVDGFLFPAGDTEALRDRLLWMYDHRTDAVEMGKIGRKKMETDFNSEVHYQKIMDVYHKFL